MPRVDYDRIAHLYDEPLRDHPVDPHLIAFLRERPDRASTSARILDVGCGTGRQLIANRVAFPDVSAVGLDLSAGMLAVARARGPDIGWVRGDASRLPFRSESFDYATNQFSYHHIRDTVGFIHEVLRVLTPGGRFVMTNIDPWAMPNWIIYQFFPDARDLDHQDFRAAEIFADLMRDAGFRDVRITRSQRQTRSLLSEFLAYASQRHRASQFIALSDEHYQAGVRRVERAAADAANAQATVNSEFCLLTIKGDKPSSVDPGSETTT